MLTPAEAAELAQLMRGRERRRAADAQRLPEIIAEARADLAAAFGGDAAPQQENTE